jgi:hypothetical protein
MLQDQAVSMLPSNGGVFPMTTDLTNGSYLLALAGIPGQLLQPKLIPSLREALRFRRYSLKTEKAYVQWV